MEFYARTRKTLRPSWSRTTALPAQVGSNPSIRPPSKQDDHTQISRKLSQTPICLRLLDTLGDPIESPSQRMLTARAPNSATVAKEMRA